MKRAAGFTLIELVIVIVILGILGAVAAPRFFNLQGDAYGANLEGLKNSMESAATLANTRAILKGVDKKPSETGADLGDGVTADLVYGYPAASENGIMQVITYEDVNYVFSAVSAGLAVSPKARATNSTTANAECAVTYEPATSESRPTIKVDKSGC